MKKRIIVAVLVFLMLVWLILPVMSGFARLSASLYLNRLSDDDYIFKGVEYSSHYGLYIVYYTSPSGARRSIMVGPKLFPFFIEYDSFIQKG